MSNRSTSRVGDAAGSTSSISGSAPLESDVAIVGGGLAGSLAALILARKGFDVTLFDLQETAKPEFRAEQLVGPQIGRLEALGVLSAMTQITRLCQTTVNARSGRIVDRTRVDQYGVPYHHMVAAVRTHLPSSVRRIYGRVASLETGPDRQTVRTSDGQVISARLLILATGLSTVLPRRLGIASTMIRAGHSLALGFDVALAEPVKAGLLPLTYYGGEISQKADYLALFPMDNALRANLFTYQARDSAWTHAFCASPGEALGEVMPGLRNVLGSFSITSPIQVRSNDLRVAADPARDGVVLIGDAFQTPCPAAGTGIDRLLSDLTVLCDTHVPGWLASPGMGIGKIAAYYDDPVKRAFDAECLRIANYRRAVSTEQSLRWKVHRQQVLLRRTLKATVFRNVAKVRLGSNTMAPSL